jgi:hypothetical protein
MDFESISLTARTKCLMHLQISILSVTSATSLSALHPVAHGRCDRRPWHPLAAVPAERRGRHGRRWHPVTPCGTPWHSVRGTPSVAPRGQARPARLVSPCGTQWHPAPRGTLWRPVARGAPVAPPRDVDVMSALAPRGRHLSTPCIQTARARSRTEVARIEVQRLTRHTSPDPS